MRDRRPDGVRPGRKEERPLRRPHGGHHEQRPIDGRPLVAPRVVLHAKLQRRIGAHQIDKANRSHRPNSRSNVSRFERPRSTLSTSSTSSTAPSRRVIPLLERFHVRVLLVARRALPPRTTAPAALWSPPPAPPATSPAPCAAAAAAPCAPARPSRPRTR